jgi:hypothetical protein
LPGEATRGRGRAKAAGTKGFGAAGGTPWFSCMEDCRPGNRKPRGGDCRDGSRDARRRLEDIGNDFFVVFLKAGFVGFPGAGGTDFVGDDAICERIDGADELGPEGLEPVEFEAALEDGVLNAQTVVLADFGHFGEAPGMANIVGNDGEHEFLAAAMAAAFAGSEE